MNGLTKREQRVIRAFINCVEHGEYTFDYACILIEDTSKYGWISDEAKEVFYAHFEPEEEPEAEQESQDEPGDPE